MKYQFVYLNVLAVCLNELDSVCLNGRASQGKPANFLLVYLNIRIFKGSYRIAVFTIYRLVKGDFVFSQRKIHLKWEIDRECVLFVWGSLGTANPVKWGYNADTCIINYIEFYSYFNNRSCEPQILLNPWAVDHWGGYHLSSR